jgi:FAD:protein FMN transferase
MTVAMRTELAMGTRVTIQVLRSGEEVSAALDRAFHWFHEVEKRCTRFDPESELRRLAMRPGVAVPVSTILFEAVRFGLMVADATDGAFDPTVGRRMEARGFDRHHRSGVITSSAGMGDQEAGDQETSYRDVELDPERCAILLRRPLTLDLGAVAKGLAIDLAARELAPFHDFAIDAGGDLYLGGCNEQGAPWRVGIRHPGAGEGLIASLQVSGRAVCTSGGYERPAARASHGEHHILDPRTGVSPRAVASATVVAPGAMLADALATAAFALGPEEGMNLLHSSGVDGLIVAFDCQSQDFQLHQTRKIFDAA